MTSPDGAGIPDKEDVGGWAGGSTGPLAILEQFGQYLIMRPLDRLLSGLLGTEPGSFDTVEELVQDLIPAIIRKVLGDLGSLLGGGSTELDPGEAADIVSKIPVVGDIAKALQGISSGINSALQDGADFISGIVGRHQDLTNMVWSGATQQNTEEQDRTEQQVRDAVSALKARSDTLRSENELRYGSSVPIWQGLVPGGDVTCSVDNLNLDEWISLTDSRGDTSDIFQPITQVNQGGIAVAVFRARSTVRRDFVTFIAQTVATGMTEFRVGLWTYRYDEDKWEMVARSGNITTDISTTADWVDAPLETSYSPEVGELMAVTWYCNGGQVHLASSRTIQVDEPLPAYHSVPYGTNTTLFSNTNYAPGSKVALTKEAVTWQIGGTPFAQIAPNLGQEVELPPQYWFDDFNSYKSGYNGLGWPSGGKFQFQGTTDGSQSIYITSQMSTDRMRVEASASGTTAVDCGVAIHCDANGSYGVRVAVSSSEIRVYTADWGGTFTQRATAGNTSGAARWSVEFIPGTSTYVVQKNGTTVVSWQDTGNLASRGKGRRSAGLRVSRSTFINSPSWDDFLVFDVTDD